MGKGPYFFIYGHKPIYHEDVKGNLPPGCCYPLVNADSADLLRFKDGAELLIQRLDSDPFVVDLIQLNCDKPFSFKFRVKKPRLFLSFLIEGAVNFYAEDGSIISHTRTLRFYATYNGRGTYKVKPYASQNIALVVTMKPNWAKKVCRQFPYLRKLIEEFRKGILSYDVMPQCHMDNMIRTYLQEVHTYSNENPGALNGTLRKYISLILEHYEKLVGEKKKSLAYRARDCINSYFSNPMIGVERLASDLATTPKTLTKHFKYEFGVTPYAYLIHLRMKRARELMEQGEQKATDVYWQVGYDDVKSFRAQYRKTFGSRSIVIESELET